MTDADRNLLALRAHAVWPTLKLLAFTLEGAEAPFGARREAVDDDLQVCALVLLALYAALTDGSQEEGEALAQYRQIAEMTDDVTPALLRRWATAWRAYAERLDADSAVQA